MERSESSKFRLKRYGTQLSFFIKDRIYSFNFLSENLALGYAPEFREMLKFLEQEWKRELDKSG